MLKFFKSYPCTWKNGIWAVDCLMAQKNHFLFKIFEQYDDDGECYAERKYEEQEKKDDNDDASNANGVDDYY